MKPDATGKEQEEYNTHERKSWKEGSVNKSHLPLLPVLFAIHTYVFVTGVTFPV